MTIFALNTKVDYTIYEEMPSGSNIGNLLTDTNLKLIQPEFIFYEPSQEIVNSITLNKISGKMTVKNPIDREKICPDIEKGLQCKLEMTILVPKDTWINVEIVIQDINDHIPTFERLINHIKISENVPIGHQVVLSTPKDNDAEDSVLDNYLLIGKLTSHFSLNSAKRKLFLVVITKLDYENPELRLFNGTLRVCDNREPKLCGSQILMIEIENFNDNKPKCWSNHQNIEIDEDTKPKTILIKINATDDDYDEYGNLTYSLVQTRGLIKLNKKFFDINKYSGELILLKSLDINLGSKIELIIEIKDGKGYEAHAIQCSINIYIIDKNNHRPTIKINAIYNNDNYVTNSNNYNKLQVKENEEAGWVICMVMVIDEDIDDNGNVSCKLITNNSEKYVELVYATSLKNTKIYSLKTVQTFDREQFDGFSIQVRCSDRGIPSLTSELNLDIVITDINEYPPEFLQKDYYAEVVENNDKFVWLLTVNATDLDKDAILTYQLSSSVENIFSINSTSGAIYTISSLDRERQSSYHFEVFVEDNNQQKSIFTAIAKVNVTIIDVNDNPPVLTGLKLYFIKENQQPYTIIGNLNGTDSDLGVNGTVSYHLVSVTDIFHKFRNSTFLIDYNKGVIFSQIKLDRELCSEYKLHVLLKDNAPLPSQLSRMETVTIIVTDVNDHAPIWLYPNFQLNYINISRTQILNNPEIIVLQVSDKDLNNNFTFYMEKQSTKYFDLNRFTGAITRISNFILLGPQTIVVKACDSGEPILCSSSLNITINITPHNEPDDSQLHINNHKLNNIGTQQQDRYTNTNLLIMIVSGVLSCILCLSLVIVSSICVRHTRRHRRRDIDDLTQFHGDSPNQKNTMATVAAAGSGILRDDDREHSFLRNGHYYSTFTGLVPAANIPAPDLCRFCVTEPLLPFNNSNHHPMQNSTIYTNSFVNDINNLGLLASNEMSPSPQVLLTPNLGGVAMTTQTLPSIDAAVSMHCLLGGSRTSITNASSPSHPHSILPIDSALKCTSTLLPGCSVINGNVTNNNNSPINYHSTQYSTDTLLKQTKL